MWVCSWLFRWLVCVCSWLFRWGFVVGCLGGWCVFIAWCLVCQGSLGCTNLLLMLAQVTFTLSVSRLTLLVSSAE